jgi:hypothetical protein
LVECYLLKADKVVVCIYNKRAARCVRACVLGDSSSSFFFTMVCWIKNPLDFNYCCYTDRFVQFWKWIFPYIIIILIQASAKILPPHLRYVCPTRREWIDLQKTGVMTWWRLKEISGSISRILNLQNTGVDELVKRGFIQIVLVTTHLLHTFFGYNMEAGTRTFLENLEKQVLVEFL